MGTTVRNRILVLMGEISAGFSSLEAQMGVLLAKLIDTSTESIVGSFLADDFTLARTTELVRRFSRYRFMHSEDMIQRFVCLCRSVDEVRIQRNLFVHGLWNFDPKILAQGKIVVLDMRWKEDKKSKHWSRGKEHVFTERDLVDMRNNIGDLFRVVCAINDDTTASKMMPHWQRNHISEQSSPACS